MAVTVTDADNRGTDEVPYGYVYFSDGTRVCYVGTEVKDGTGGWGPITPAHKEAARAYLNPEKEGESK